MITLTELLIWLIVLVLLIAAGNARPPREERPRPPANPTPQRKDTP